MAGRRRRRVAGARLSALAVVLAAVVVAGATPATSFTFAHQPRPAGAPVVADADGAFGLDVAASVQANQVDRLLDATNRLGVAVTVTVTVTNTDRHDLYVGGTNHGDQASFTLADAASQRVDVEAHASVNEVVVDVTASAAGVSVVAIGRSATVTSGGGPPGGGSPGGP